MILRREKFLGFKLASIRNANERCHKVTEVTRNRPADLAGLKPGDKILKQMTNQDRNMDQNQFLYFSER